MFEATYLTSDADYENYNRATNPALMTPFFERGLKKLWGDNFVLKNVRVPRVFPHKDGGLTVQYELTAENIPSISGKTVYFCGRLLEQGEPFKKYISKLQGDFIQIDDIGLVIPIFPYDPKLPALAKIDDLLNDSNIMDKICAKLNCSSPVTFSFSYEIIGYRLERRAILLVTAEVTDNNQNKHLFKFIAKFFKPSSSKRAYEAFKLLENNGFSFDSGDNITVPEILYFNEKNGILLMEYFEGISIRSLPEQNTFGRICVSAGSTIRKLHGLKLPGLPFYSSLDEIETLKRNIGFLKKIFPSVIDDFKNAVELLEANKKFDDNEILSVCSHRDFYDKQFLYSDERSVLIDCDNLAMADPALDYGNFTAHMELRKTQHQGKEDLIESGKVKFERAYGNIDDLEFKQRAIWWQGASLTRLSMLYLLRPAWSDISPYILQRAFSLFS